MLSANPCACLNRIGTLDSDTDTTEDDAIGSSLERIHKMLALGLLAILSYSTGFVDPNRTGNPEPI